MSGVLYGSSGKEHKSNSYSTNNHSSSSNLILLIKLITWV